MSPDPARQPPRMMIGRLPNLFTRILLMGPGGREEKRQVRTRHNVTSSEQQKDHYSVGV